MVFTLFKEYESDLSVVIVSNGNPYQFGFSKAGKRIQYVDRKEDSGFIIDAEEIENNLIYVKNAGKKSCQMELLIVEIVE